MTPRQPLFLALGLVALLLASFTGTASETCITCHDFGPESPVPAMLESIHGYAEEGCAACHGPSTSHAERPAIISPDTSFGPRWSASVAQQDNQCLACHADNVAEHWQDALHMANKLTCVTCHDMHTDNDKTLNPRTQADVCTICHKVQKHGIHAIMDLARDNPVCTTCHNPHADQRPLGMMLANRSEGCRGCHNLVEMQDSNSVSAKAKSYHKVMVQKDRTCLDCHRGVAHGPAGAVEPFIPLATSSRIVTLFYPGQSDIDWILGEHPGSQPFRQGSNCQQCHRGEEAAMGAVLGTVEPTSRELNVSVREDGINLQLSISWSGNRDDSDIALMWGDDGNEAFRRGGCWAACHGDMPGMGRDRGLELGKYLGVSRQQQQRIGHPALVKNGAALNKLMDDGKFVEMWHVKLADGKAEAGTATLLSELVWSRDSRLRAEANFANGRWTVSLRRPLAGAAQQKSFVKGKRYTFGVAMHSALGGGAQHWVSLPMTLSLDGDDTDFRAD